MKFKGWRFNGWKFDGRRFDGLIVVAAAACYAGSIMLFEHDVFQQSATTPDQVRGRPFPDRALGDT
jgi:hypothetical protein